MTHTTSWQDLYAAAMLELDRDSLQQRIDAAQLAIRKAMAEQMSRGDNGGSPEEMQSMADALHCLQALRRVEFRTSDSSTSQTSSLNSVVSQ